LFEFDCEINIIAHVNTLTNPFLKPTSTEQHRQCVLRKERTGATLGLDKCVHGLEYSMLYITVKRV